MTATPQMGCLNWCILKYSLVIHVISVIFVYVYQLTNAGFQPPLLLFLYFLSYSSSFVTVSSSSLMLLLPSDE